MGHPVEVQDNQYFTIKATDNATMIFSTWVKRTKNTVLKFTTFYDCLLTFISECGVLMLLPRVLLLLLLLCCCCCLGPPLPARRVRPAEARHHPPLRHSHGDQGWGARVREIPHVRRHSPPPQPHSHLIWSHQHQHQHLLLLCRGPPPTHSL